MTQTMNELGVVVIGRNEGERLRRCLESVRGQAAVVYVDSGSRDGSVELARALGVEVVCLDLARPFTAARARNEGFARLERLHPALRHVQFVDGDCEIVAGWLAEGVATLEQRPDVGVVCGRLRERFPETSPYNRLANLEWDGPVGAIIATGGLFMTRAEVFRDVGGFNSEVMAAEEDELGVRIRSRGLKVVRLDAAMAWHDMAMTRFGQWWKRAVRTGHAYAEGVVLHGRTSERHFVRQFVSALFWGVVVPLLAFGLAWPTRGLSLALLAGFPVLFWRIARYGRRRGWSPADARLFALGCVVAKFPQVVGIFQYGRRRLSGRPVALIEHKEPARAASLPHGDSVRA
jgi:GT2 family glycosyltransferase